MEKPPLKDFRGLLLESAPQAERKAAGLVLMDGIAVADTLQCVHGGEHFVVIKGSGKRRGFCPACGGPTCGSQAHSVCYNHRKKIDDYEKGKLLIL